MKNFYRIFAAFFAFVLVFLLVPTSVVSADTTWNTYTFDYWWKARQSPDAYTVNKTLVGTQLGLTNFESPQGLYTIGNMVYICDTNNNRIVECKYENDTFNLVRVIDKINNNGKQETLSGPEDCYVTTDGQIYIADTNNNRILRLDANLNVIKVITKPEKEQTLSADFVFLPQKLVVDSSGRIFSQVKNVNNGFMEFDNNGGFTGYMGANPVKFNFIDYVWKLIATKEQRAQMESFVPTEYDNLALDSEGFIYATTSTFNLGDLKSDQAKPIRKLNAQGTDILVKNDKRRYPIGEQDWGPLDTSSKFSDICVLDNDTYYAIDTTKGKIFGYDFQGNLLYAFGGYGVKEGCFKNPSAIDNIGNDLLALDKETGTLTLFALTEFGKYINDGLQQYKDGDYEGSANSWRQVLRMDGNNELAYIGIGRALLREEKYKEAMDYFKLKYDTVNYSKAFKLYRKEWIEDHIAYIVVGLIVIIVLIYVRGFVKKIRKEVNSQ